MSDLKLKGKPGISQESEGKKQGQVHRGGGEGTASCPTLCTTDGTIAIDTAAQGSNIDGKFLPEGEEIQ